MENEKIMIGGIVFLLIVSMCGCLSSNNVNAEYLRTKIIEKFNNVQSYTYRSSGNMTRPGSDLPGYGLYSLNGNVNVLQKHVKSYMDIELTNELIEYYLKHNITITNETFNFFHQYFYYENETLYKSFDNRTWDGTQHGSLNWYAFAFLDRQFRFILENATLSKLADEAIDGCTCYTLQVTPKLENLTLKPVYMDLLFPLQNERRSIYFLFEQNYSTDIKYWIDKDTYLIKKMCIKASNNFTYSYNSSKNITRHSLSNYETEILFYNYDQEDSVESPWQIYIQQASELLNYLNYSNTRFGFGMNLPYIWIVDENSMYGSSVGLVPTFSLRDQSITNLSLIIGPPSRSSGNLSEEVQNKLMDIGEKLNDTTHSQYYINYTLDRNGPLNVNGMNAYEFVTSMTTNNITIKTRDLFIEKDERLFDILFYGYEELYNEYLPEINDCINTSFTIIAPYFEIYEINL
ncbi:MAG: hypothetical protein V1726_04450 [Methanobacteriota archaeon]